MGPQEEMFLSSSNLFSTIKEGPAHTPADLPTQQFSVGAKSWLTFLTGTVQRGPGPLQGYKQQRALPSA